MMVMWVPIFSASSRSWLTKMMVFFSSACSCSNSSCSLVRISGSSAENGSSINRIGASVAKARARPTRCCMPPESSCAYFFDHWSRWTSSSCFFTRSLRSASGIAGKFEAEADIFLDRAPRQQAELLEHHRHLLLAQPPQGRLIAGDDVDRAVAVLDQHLAARHHVQPVDGAQQRRLAGARQAHQHRNLALMHGQAGAGAAQHIAGLFEDLGARGAAVDQRQRTGLDRRRRRYRHS